MSKVNEHMRIDFGTRDPLWIFGYIDSQPPRTTCPGKIRRAFTVISHWSCTSKYSVPGSLSKRIIELAYRSINRIRIDKLAYIYVESMNRASILNRSRWSPWGVVAHCFPIWFTFISRPRPARQRDDDVMQRFLLKCGIKSSFGDTIFLLNWDIRI